MRKIVGIMVVVMGAMVASVYADAFTNVTTQTEGKTGLKALGEIINGNNSVAETRIAALEAAGVGGTLEPAYLIVGDATSNATGVAMSGDATISDAGAVTIGANKILESMLKAVDTAADEDYLTYESTTGDFEWHSAAETQAKFTEGSYADSTVVSADIKDGVVSVADMASGNGITCTNTSIWQTTGDALITNVFIYSKGICVSWTQNGTSVVP